MASKKADPAPQQTVWVNVDLDKAQSAEMKDMFPTAAETMVAVEGMLADGYSITLKAEPARECFAAYCFPNRNEPLNAGFALAARGSKIASALRGLVYRHCVVFQGNWRVPAASQRVDED